jgi:hypothetical protein
LRRPATRKAAEEDEIDAWEIGGIKNRRLLIHPKGLLFSVVLAPHRYQA